MLPNTHHSTEITCIDFYVSLNIATYHVTVANVEIKQKLTHNNLQCVELGAN
jgi:hypothetical protein